ncbi:MAG: hypothetical protein ACFBRM_11815 [Pikeienuella sp.]
MVGSNLDEGERRDTRRLFIYGDGAREGVAGGLLVTLGGVVLFSSVEAAWLPLALKVALTGAVALAVGVGLAMWLGGIGARREARAQAAYRDAREVETRRQIAEMRAREARRS